jgi:hypothetical protein
MDETRGQSPVIRPAVDDGRHLAPASWAGGATSGHVRFEFARVTGLVRFS